ncbi:MAG: ABC transporter substrate-binding protein [Maritimibacter sp.]|uniref:ABC transporter substrate-binding protein n=1 Tax=Maritimibacter sp. TaxID=2003363 RepID=UPI001E0FD64F|nr:ABC transporter substrate-binding protein [Maritimibacter sp.]MBL6429949.1 ABC transporter substrate-binding protein [Maritimibacter sp.]
MKMKQIAKNLAVAATFAAGPALAADDEVVIGMSAALSGGAAGTYAAPAEGLKLYIDRLNDAGGVNGRTVSLVIYDDQGDASRAASNAKRFLTQDDVQMIISVSTSATFAPIISQATRREVPVLFAGSVCPAETMPPAKPLLYCSTGFSAVHDSIAMVDYLRERESGDITIGFSAMGIPISRAGMEEAERMVLEAGMKSAGVEIAPPGTADYTSFATKLTQNEAEAVLSWAPWSVQIRFVDALRKQGWEGNAYVGHLAEAELEMLKIKDPGLIAVGSNVMLFENSEATRTLVDAVTEAGSSLNPEAILDGWVGGIVVEGVLEELGEDTSAEAINAVMSNIEIDTKGLRGGPIKWTDNNHFRETIYYRAYRWSDEKGAMEIARDWKAYEVE